VLDFTGVDKEVDDFGHQSWAVKMRWFFGVKSAFSGACLVVKALS
jgi:hypothetical protein